MVAALSPPGAERPPHDRGIGLDPSAKRLRCVPDEPQVPECKEDTRPEKVCRLVDKEKGVEECFLECVPDEGEPEPECKEGTRPVLVCRPIGDDGKEECQVECQAFDPEKPPTDKP